MRVSFVIPAYNEADNIGRCLESIHAQGASIGREYEIILVDNESSDSTAAIALGLGAIVLIAARPTTIGHIRNIGVAAAKGDILVFLDADTALASDWGMHFVGVLSVLKSRPRTFAGSFCLPPLISNYFLTNWFCHLAKGRTNYLGSAHLITTKLFFDELHGFSGTLSSGEDFDLCRRCTLSGGEIVVDDKLKVYHHDYPLTVRRFVLREMWHGSGDVQNLAAFCSSKVALVSVVFLFFHVSILVSIITGGGLVLQLVCLLLVLLLLSVLKLGRLDLAFKALPITYLYYLGRSLALLKRLGKLVLGVVKS